VASLGAGELIDNRWRSRIAGSPRRL